MSRLPAWMGVATHKSAFLHHLTELCKDIFILKGALKVHQASQESFKDEEALCGQVIDNLAASE